MTGSLPQLMDLAELKKDVLDKDPGAALPCHLSDLWLNRIAESLERVLEYPSGESDNYLAGPLALVVRLLCARSLSPELDLSESRLYECLLSYRIEVALETVNRKTKIKIASATLETIFTDRLLTRFEDVPEL